MALAPEELARRARDAWQPNAAALAAAQAAPFPYVRQPAGLDRQLPIGPGVTALTRYVRAHSPLVYESYAAGRELAPGQAASMHHAGRAVDLMIREVGGRPDRRGDAIADWLLANARSLGVTYLIWAGTQWNSRDGRASLYQGPEDHHNHLHVELTPEAAAGASVIPGAGGAPGGAWAAVALLAAVGAAAAWWARARRAPAQAARR